MLRVMSNVYIYTKEREGGGGGMEKTHFYTVAEIETNKFTFFFDVM